MQHILDRNVYFRSPPPSPKGGGGGDCIKALSAQDIQDILHLDYFFIDWDVFLKFTV